MIAILKQIMKNEVSSNVETNTNNEEIDNAFFCIEDTMLSKDLKIRVNGLGLLNFPIDEKSITKLIELSTKAKFGRGEATVLDTNVRNTQMIPASQLKITITPNVLNSLVDRIGKGLNTPEGSSLKLHFHNLLIYGPGQFFKKHKDTEKLEGMLATLVIVLPYPHKGGELIIEHDNKKHLFFGSEYPEIVKCVAFYSDCDHEIKEVTEGYRVAITCNIVLDVQNTSLTASVDKSLDNFVQNYFEDDATKLVYQMNHSYSEHSLKWNLLKSEDRICANALFAVAKKQGRVPCLALAKHHETYDVEDVYYPEDKPTLIEAETELYYWVDENNLNYTSPLGAEYVDDEESFFIKKTSKLFKPYEVEGSGPTGNEGETEDYWYRRACVVLFANKWICYHGFQSALTELHQMTKEEGKDQLLLKKINAIGEDFNQYDFWILPYISDMLLDIVIYLNSAKKAEMILPKLKSVLLNVNKVDCLIQLENQFDSQTWDKILHIWEKDGYLRYNNTTEGISFINKYFEIAGERKKSHLVSGILGKAVDEFIERSGNNWKFKYIYDRPKDDKIEKLSNLLKLTIDLECEDLERKLMEHVLSASTVYPTFSKAQLCCKLQEVLKPEEMFPRFKRLVTSTLNEVTTLLSRIGNHFDWSMPITSCCKCKRFCTPLLQFFSSKTSTEFVKQATKTNKVHVDNNFFSFLEDPYNISFDKVKYNTYTIRIQKLPTYIEKQQKFKDDLLSFQRSLQAMDMIKVEGNTDVKSEDIKEELEEPEY